MGNLDRATVDGFGDEWSRFDQRAAPAAELGDLFNRYFSIFPWKVLPRHAVGFDLGCGSGRWAKLVAPRVGTLHCIDASERALAVAKENLSKFENCEFHNASVDQIPFPDATMDFGYSLGVLHHIPDTKAGLAACVKKLKPGAPFLLYLYYRFDNRPWWFVSIWRLSEMFRFVIARMPHALRYWSSQLFAASVYWPLARLSLVVEKMGLNPSQIPLSQYRNRSFYTMRTDALDRLGTRLEQRFTWSEIKAMMESCGLENVQFSMSEPYWCAVGFRAK